MFQRWSKIVLILMLFGMGLAMISVMNFFGSEPEMVSAPIPDDAEMIVRIDAKTLWRKGVYSIVFETENYSMIDQELKKIINNRFIRRTSKILPIDFNKDIVAFHLMSDKQHYQVAVFQLMNVTKFMKMISEEQIKNRLAFHVGNNGYLIYGPRNCSKEQLAKIKKRITSAPEIAFQDLGDRSDFVTINSGLKEQHFNYSIGVQQSKESFKVSGDIHGKIDFEPMKYSVRSEGLTLTLSYNPQALAGTISNDYPELKAQLLLLTQVTDPFPYFADKQLTGVSVDYFGVQVENSIEGLPSIQGMLPLAKMNGVYRFDKKLSMDSVMACFPVKVHTGPASVRLHGITYYIRLIDDHNLFVGVDENAVIPGSRADLFRIKGNLGNITNINSSSFFVKAVLKNFKPIKNLTTFYQSTEKIDFAIQQASKNNFTVSGILPFKKDKNSMNEVFKFILLSSDQFTK